MQKRIITVLLIFFVSSKVIFAQNTATLDYNLCKNELGKLIKDKGLLKFKDSVVVSNKILGDSILELNVINTTSDTLYLFKTYFKDIYYSAFCLHRLDTIEKVYKISFLPIIPFVGVNKSDLLKNFETEICYPFQVLYDFIKLVPNSYYTVRFNIKPLFKEFFKTDQIVSDFEANKLSKYNKNFLFQYLSKRYLTKKYKLIFEFALYDHVYKLCNYDSYYLEERAYNEQAQSFKKISISIDMNYFTKNILK